MMLCSVYIIVVLESPVVVKRHALFHRLLGGREGVSRHKMSRYTKISSGTGRFGTDHTFLDNLGQIGTNASWYIYRERFR